MEPFAPAYGIFPDFPEATFFLEQSSPAMDQLLREEMPRRLFRYKYLISERSLSNPAWFRVDRLLSNVVKRFGLFAPAWLLNRVRRFDALNLNRIDGSYPLFPKESPSTWVIKELRFAGKIPILMSAYPDARYVIIIRHPSATVHSILTWFGRHRLVELRSALDTYLEKVEVQTAGAPYHPLIERCRNAGIAHKVALYWRISYETLYRQLKDSPLAKFVIYEQLALQPQETTSSIFSWLDLPWSDSVDDYLMFSSSSLPERVTALMTNRDSRRAYRAWLDSITASTSAAVEEVTGDSFLLPWFTPYYEG